MSDQNRTKRVHEGQYVVEVEVRLTDFEQPWGPYLQNEDVLKLDAARKALRNGDLSLAAKYGPVYRMVPVHAA